MRRHEDIEQLARDIRLHSLRMVHRAGASHIGSCLSAADLLAVLYQRVLRIRSESVDDPTRDRFILSKGHAAAALYAALALRGFFPLETLADFCADGSSLAGHVTRGLPGIEVSTGSLGHGPGIGCGMALAGKRDGLPYRTVVLMSDGECDAGSVWEAALFAAHHQLDNLTMIVDCNAIQSFGRVEDVLKLEPLTDKWRAFGWAVREIDGHDVDQINDALLTLPHERDKPTAIIARTVKGKGVAFMEDDLAWHYRSPTDEQLRQAETELAKH